MKDHTKAAYKRAITPLIFLGLLLLCLPVLSQTTSSSIPADRAFRKGKIIKTDRTVLRGRKMVVGSQAVTFKDETSKQEVSVPLSEVEHIVKIGNHAFIGAAAGGGLALLACLEAIVEAEADPLLEPRENAGTITMGITAGGVVVGALIGSFILKEKTVYKRGTVRTQISLLPRISRSPGRPARISLLTVEVLF